MREVCFGVLALSGEMGGPGLGSRDEIDNEENNRRLFGIIEGRKKIRKVKIE